MDKEQQHQQDNNNDASSENQGGVKKTVVRRTLRSSVVRTNTAPNKPEDAAAHQDSPQPDAATQPPAPTGNEETPSTTKRKLHRTPSLDPAQNQQLEAAKDSSAAPKEAKSDIDPFAAATHQPNDEKSPDSPPRQHQEQAQQVEEGLVKGRIPNEIAQISYPPSAAVVNEKSLSSLSEISPLSGGKNGERFFASEHLQQNSSGRGQNEDDDADCVITLVGNKSDLSHLRAVDYDDALAFAQERNMDFYETSALSNLNVESTLKGMVNKIYAQSDSDVENEYPKPTRNLGGNMNADNGENFCCLF